MQTPIFPTIAVRQSISPDPMNKDDCHLCPECPQSAHVILLHVHHEDPIDVTLVHANKSPVGQIAADWPAPMWGMLSAQNDVFFDLWVLGEC
jgi:hypothetical protein